MMRQWITLVENASKPSHEEIAAYVFQNIDWAGGSGDQVIYDYKRHHDQEIDHDHELGELGDDVDTSTPEFQKWFADWVEEQYGEAEWSIEDKIEDGHLILYRCITAPRDWKPDPARHPGIYWSWDERAADAHWGNFDKQNIKWMIVGSVRAMDIDWLATLAMNSNPSYQKEKEVRIREGAPVEIIRTYPQKDTRGW